MNLKILLVEKDQDSVIKEGLRLVCDLEECSCDFTTIEDSSVVAHTHKDQSFDLIIIDLCLDGMEVIKQIREFDTVVAFIAIAGSGATLDTAIEAIHQNVCAFMRKPFTLSEMVTQAQNAVARSLLRKKIYTLSQQEVLKRHHG